MLQPLKYNSFWTIVDLISFVLVYPLFLTTNLFMASFIPTTGTRISSLVLGSLLTALLCLSTGIVWLPVGLAGTFLRLILNGCAQTVPYRYREYPLANRERDQSRAKKSFSVATANLCLLPDFLAKFNNNAMTYKRCVQIAKKFTNFQNEELAGHEENITTDIPKLDFVCFQEVWGRETAWILMRELKKRFRYFLFDVGINSWKINRYFFGSGLMFASRFPILDADFHNFKIKTFQATFTSIGLLQVKVQVGNELRKEIGYIATTHLQSYQGKKQCLLPQLDECVQWLKDFRKKTLTSEEIIAFDVFCGDFNFDNLSPGDKKCSHHELFNEYSDPCRLAPGLDYDWVVGTEFRQRMLWEEDINSPEKLKQVLKDPVERRRFMLDADVVEQTIKLAFLKPPYDENGQIQPCWFGGKRRIDYILHNRNYPVDVIQINFITALTQLTDHIPVVMKFSKKYH